MKCKKKTDASNDPNLEISPFFPPFLIPICYVNHVEIQYLNFALNSYQLFFENWCVLLVYTFMSGSIFEELTVPSQLFKLLPDGILPFLNKVFPMSLSLIGLCSPLEPNFLGWRDR